MQELNLTFSQSVLLLISLMALLILLLRRKSYVTIELERETPQSKNNRDEVVQARYGAYIQARGHYYN